MLNHLADDLLQSKQIVTGKIFISYSRKKDDYRELAKALSAKLTQMGFNMWRDVEDIQAGEEWWTQIKETIEQSETLILCMSPEALESEVVKDEWRHARRVGTRVIPIVVAEVDFTALPRWMSKLDWLDFRAGQPEADQHWARLVNQLNTPYQRRPVPFTVPNLPTYFVKREDVFNPLIEQLLDSHRENPVAITTALQGSGGFGKTTLAIDLCHDQEIQDAFDNGILWIEFGETPNLLTLLNTQIKILGGDGNELEIKAASVRLRDLLKDRDMLVVLDDVWNPVHADPFLQRTEKTRVAFLITTRLQEVVTGVKATTPVKVDEMSPQQALALLSAGLTISPEHQADLEKLVKRLGNWALLLELTNGYLRQQNTRYDLGNAIQRAQADLDDEGFEVFNQRNPEARNQAITKSLAVSRRLLAPEEDQQFIELGIFPEEAQIPISTLALYWGLTERKTERFCELLHDLSLAKYDTTQQTLRLHDVIRQLVGKELPDYTLLHQRLIGRYDLHALPDTYSWRNIAYHLQKAEQLPQLRELLLSPQWLQAKLDATTPNYLISDCDLLANDETIRLIRSALSISTHILNNDKRGKKELPLQLSGRLVFHQNKPEIVAFLHKIQPTFPSFVAQSPVFKDQAGGALVRTLVGHTDIVTSVAVLGEFAISASGKLFSSRDNSVRVWNWVSGEFLRTFEGHTRAVTSVALSGEYAISASHDQTLRVWNWQTGEALRTLREHRYIICVALSGEYAISASYDQTLWVWNWQTGEFLRTFEGHTDQVTSVVLSGEYVISASKDKTLRVWNWQTGEFLRTLEGHTLGVNSVALSGEYAISASSDQTLRVWNWQTGEFLRTFEGHTDQVTSVVMSGEYVISASKDKTLRVWNWQTGETLWTFAGHTLEVNSVAMSGEYAISASSDQTLRVWKLPLQGGFVRQSGEALHALEGHTSGVNSVAMSGEYAISASDDYSLRVWELPLQGDSARQSGETLRALEGHTSGVNSVALSGEYAISASFRELRVWNWQTGEFLWTFEGHTSYVRSVAMSGKYVILASYDHSLRVWNWQTGEALRTLEGHTESVRSVALSGEYVISASDDHSLRVWNWQTGEALRTLEGHTESVRSVALSGEYAISASDDYSLRVWNWQTGEALRTLEGHTESVRSVALSGEYAITTSRHKTLRVWNWQTGEQLGIFYGDAPLTAVAVRAEEDGLLIVAGDSTGRVLFLRFRLPH